MERVSIAEIRQTVGILMYMSVVRMPSMRLFWKKSMNIFAVSKVRRLDAWWPFILP
jgi:hypothetical protein